MTDDRAGRLAALRPDGPDEMGRELAGGPAAVEATLAVADGLRAELDAALRGAERVILIGTGASFAMAQAAAPLFRAGGSAGGSAGGRPRPIVLIEAAAALLAPIGEEEIRPGDLVIVVSQSGGSPETLAAARRARAAGAPVLAVTAATDSRLAGLAGLVLHTPCGSEGGAATKSELAAIAALATLAGALPSDAPSGRSLRASLESIVADADGAVAAGQALGAARHVWAIGFGAAAGLARATTLLLHEKALLVTVAMTPSEFRHGPIEAAGPDGAVLLIETDRPDGRRTIYLARLAAELDELRVPLIVTGPGPLPAGAISLPVPGPPDVAALLATLLRIQQAARIAAHVRGTYRDGFRILRSIVTAAADLD